MSLAAVIGGMVLMGIAVAEAAGIEGGCVATLNGADPASLTAGHPLVVHKGQTVMLSGTVPAEVVDTPRSQLMSVTKIRVQIVDGLYSNSTVRQGQGPQWGGSVNVDRYLKYGVGLYKVNGSAVGTPNWECNGEAYVRLEDGNPLGKPIGEAAAGLMVVGAAGGVLAQRSGSPTADDVKKDFKSDAENLLGLPPDQPTTPAPEPEVVPERPAGLLADAGCIFLLLLAVVSSRMALSGGAAVAAGGLRSGARQTRLWKRGHAIAGFVSGLLFGLGAMVLGQQYGRWTLNVVTVIVIPLLAAVIVGIRAWMGRPYRVTFPTAGSVQRQSDE